MFKKIAIVLKKIIISPFLLYTYNLISSPIGLTIPINLFTVSTIFILGFPGLMGLVVLLKFLS